MKSCSACEVAQSESQLWLISHEAKSSYTCRCLKPMRNSEFWAFLEMTEEDMSIGETTVVGSISWGSAFCTHENPWQFCSMVEPKTHAQRLQAMGMDFRID